MLAYWDQGRLKEAEELEVRIKETNLRVLGAEHLAMLRSIVMTYVIQFKDGGRRRRGCRVRSRTFPSGPNIRIRNLVSTYKNQGPRKWRSWGSIARFVLCGFWLPMNVNNIQRHGRRVILGVNIIVSLLQCSRKVIGDFPNYLLTTFN